MRRIMVALAAVLAATVATPTADAAVHGPIYVIGDSITYGAGTTDPAHLSFPAEAARILDHRVRIDGHPGRCLVASGCYYPVPLVETFRSEVLHAVPRPSLVIVELGINDLTRVSSAQLEAAYAEVLREGRQAGVRVVLCTITPQAAGMTATVEQRHEVNAWLRALPSGHVLEMTRPLGGTWMDPRFDSGDGIHPDNAGARVMGRAMARYLRR